MSTIDPGIEEGIQQRADHVEADQHEQGQEQEEAKALYQPSRWWFASTACPLLAGTLGPVASGFNICSIAYDWREYIPPGGSEAIGMQTNNTLKDPPWEIAMNALSLLAAVIANGALLLNMAHRLRFSVAQPITIWGFLLAGVLLIADIAALAGAPHLHISRPEAVPDSRHALTHAFYFAIFAAVLYVIISLLMCLTVYGARKGHYPRRFQLTPPQRTLMLQTMGFITYLLLGALVYSKIEGWAFVNAVYWADVTLLTVGLGDYAPASTLGRGLLFPFAIGGILMVGLVVGSIRSLILERGKEKMGARIVEKRRSKAVHNVDARRETIKISYFARADFSVDPDLSPAQRREEEFNVMRQVQSVAERERRYFALALSLSFALILWLVGAAIFQKAEYLQEWSYMEALYFSYVSLLTIGYGDYTPHSNAGKAFFVLWSLLAVPSLTILISNMGDTIVKWFSDFTIALGSITVLPHDTGFRASFLRVMDRLNNWVRDSVSNLTPPGVLGAAPVDHEKRPSSSEYNDRLMDRLAGRLSKHLGKDQKSQPPPQTDDLEQDLLFYHYVLARECRDLHKDLSASPPKEYKWDEWEYFLRLMGNQDDPEDFPGQKQPNILVPQALRAPSKKNLRGGKGDGDSRPSFVPSDQAEREASNAALLPSNKTSSSSAEKKGADGCFDGNLDGNVDRAASVLQRQLGKPRKLLHPPSQRDETASGQLTTWSWLSDESPLMSTQSEAEWILERLSVALERELNRARRGYKRKPPVRVRDAYRKVGTEEERGEKAEGEMNGAEERELRRADQGEE